MKFSIRFKQLFLLMSLLSIQATPAAADSSATEIQYLLSFVAQSDCLFIRNGTEYKAQDARAHIENKYQYVKSRVNSADEFISQAASKSSFSGRAYRVRCGERYLGTEQWLQTALKDYRNRLAE